MKAFSLKSKASMFLGRIEGIIGILLKFLKALRFVQMVAFAYAVSLLARFFFLLNYD